jgi:hypothetical protein
MWRTIYVTIDKKQAYSIENTLKTEGFLVKVNGSYDAERENLYEILVLKNEAKDAQDTLLEMGMI